MGLLDDFGTTLDYAVTKPFASLIDLITPEGHSYKRTKIRHYNEVFDNHGAYPRKLLSPAYDEKIITESRDGFISTLVNDGAQFIEHGEDDLMKVTDQTVISSEHILESGLDLGKTTVDDLSSLGGKLVDDSASILSMPLIILAIAGGFLIYNKM